MHRWGPEYQVHTNPELKNKFHHNTFFYDGNFRKIHPSGMSTYFPVNLHNYGQELHRCKRPNVVVVGVSSMDEHGYCCVSCDLQWQMESFYSADKIIYEVNPAIPHLPGDCALPVAMADVIIESDLSLYELQDPPIGEAEKTIAGLAAEMVHDGDCIQLGFGGIPNAIGFELMNRHDLGIHTEQIGASMARMIQQGVVTNRYKNLDKGWSVGAFIIADNFTYEYLNNHPRVMMRRGRYTNDPMIIAQQDNMVSINAALQIDLTGQVAAEAIANIQWSGTGGQSETVQGAQMSPGGKSIIAMHSTYSTTDENGKSVLHSKIVPFLAQGAAVTTSRNDTDYVVTEYGIAWLRGLNIRQRVEELIKIAHPDFRDWLREEAEKNMIW